MCIHIISKKNQLTNETLQLNNSFINLIFNSPDLHPCNNDVILLYVFSFDKVNDNSLNIPQFREKIFVFNHPEVKSELSISDIKLNSKDLFFTPNKKKLLHIFPELKNIIDLKMKSLLTHSLYYDFNEEKIQTSIHNKFYREFWNYSKVNQLIPIYKHGKYMQNQVQLALSIGHVINQAKDNNIDFTFWNDLIIDNFSKIERNGLHVNKALFEKKFGKAALRHVNKNNLIFSEYNLYTITGRPSNRFGGINFAALNKKDDTRQLFDSRFGKKGILIEADYSSYHLYLIASLIGYKFPQGISAHKYMAKKYFNTNNPSKEQIQKSKKISFQLLYGAYNVKYKNIEFFKKTNEFINELWYEYESNGYVIKLPVSERKIQGVKSKDKLFNYYIQGYETERNAIIINDLLKLLESYKSKLILYTYDSFLFDFNFNDGKKLLKAIKLKLGEQDLFPVKFSYGINYKDLKLLKL